MEVTDPMEKLYTEHNNTGEALVLPASNLMSFLSSQTNECAPQRVLGKRWKVVAKAALSFVDITPIEIPFMRKGKPILKTDKSIIIDSRVARAKKGPLVVPIPTKRPVLPLPWELSFTLTLFSNPDLNEGILRRVIDEGGICLGIGAYRGLFGKFVVSKWEAIKEADSDKQK
jgi:hypothetical protein